MLCYGLHFHWPALIWRLHSSQTQYYLFFSKEMRPVEWGIGSAQICRQFFGQNIDNFHEKNCAAKFEQNIEEFWKFMRFVWGIVEFPGCFEEYWKISSPWVTWVYSVDPSSVCHREYPHSIAVKNHRWLLGRHYSKSKCQSRSKFEQNIGSVPALPSKLSTRPKQNFAAKYR